MMLAIPSAEETLLTRSIALVTSLAVFAVRHAGGEVRLRRQPSSQYVHDHPWIDDIGNSY